MRRQTGSCLFEEDWLVGVAIEGRTWQQSVAKIKTEKRTRA